MNTNLRRTLELDLEFVVEAEGRSDNRLYVGVWNQQQHLAATKSQDCMHFIIERITDEARVGYIILQGVTNPNQSIELKRIVVTEKGRGHGREALQLIKRKIFDEVGAHRLWLDVKDHNVRAQRLYESEGFIVEGTLRECLRAESGFESLVVMSILRDEYHEVN
jgi:diamine N-acetyltransferase